MSIENNDSSGVEIHTNREELLQQAFEGKSVAELEAPVKPEFTDSSTSSVDKESLDPENEDNSESPKMPIGARYPIKGVVEGDTEGEPALTRIPDVDIIKMPPQDVAVVFSQPALFMTTDEDLDETNFMDKYENITETGGPDRYHWVKTASDALVSMLPRKGLLPAITREDAHWKPFVSHGKSRISVRSNPNARKEMSSGQVLTGNFAVDMFLTKNRGVRTVQVPLYGTGIWIKIQAPSLSYLSEIDRALAALKAEIGIDTNGLIDSNEDVRFKEILFDAALRLVTECNYPYKQSPIELREIISQVDIDSVIWGLACASYPNGYHLSTPCTDPVCGHVDQWLAAPARMRRVEANCFNNEQLAFMARGIKVIVTDEELERYQEHVSKHNEKFNRVVLNGDVFELHYGTVENYISFANQWFSSIDTSLLQSLGSSYNDPAVRIAALNSTTDAEDLCRYGHFVKRILLEPATPTNDPAIIEDPNTIRLILKSLQTDTDASNKFMDGVHNFIQNTIPVTFGVENEPCSKCGEIRVGEVNGEKVTKTFIPIKVGVHFFTLLQHKLVLSGMTPSATLTMLGQAVSDQVMSAEEYMSSSEMNMD